MVLRYLPFLNYLQQETQKTWIPKISILQAWRSKASVATHQAPSDLAMSLGMALRPKGKSLQQPRRTMEQYQHQLQRSILCMLTVMEVKRVITVIPSGL